MDGFWVKRYRLYSCCNNRNCLGCIFFRSFILFLCRLTLIFYRIILSQNNVNFLNLIILDRYIKSAIKPTAITPIPDIRIIGLSLVNSDTSLVPALVIPATVILGSASLSNIRAEAVINISLLIATAESKRFSTGSLTVAAESCAIVIFNISSLTAIILFSNFPLESSPVVTVAAGGGIGSS